MKDYSSKTNGGTTRYEVALSTLTKFPDTKLAELALKRLKNEPVYIHKDVELFK
jgi:hypothetical protein